MGIYINTYIISGIQNGIFSVFSRYFEFRRTTLDMNKLKTAKDDPLNFNFYQVLAFLFAMFLLHFYKRCNVSISTLIRIIFNFKTHGLKIS